MAPPLQQKEKCIIWFALFQGVKKSAKRVSTGVWYSVSSLTLKCRALEETGFIRKKCCGRRKNVTEAENQVQQNVGSLYVICLWQQSALYHLPSHHIPVPKNVSLPQSVSTGIVVGGRLCMSFGICNFDVWTDGCR
jgi:hypothetical protein